MNKEKLKIGIYTEDEIFEYLTEGEGSMLGRSMYDAIFDKIHALITENNQLKEQRQELRSWLEKEKQGYAKPKGYDHWFNIHEYQTIANVLNKLNELEGGKNE